MERASWERRFLVLALLCRRFGSGIVDPLGGPQVRVDAEGGEALDRGPGRGTDRRFRSG